MIDAKILKDWIKKHSTNGSSVFPHGWVNTEELIKFIQEHDASFNTEDE